MRISTHTMLPAAIASACLLCCSIAVAKKPVNPPGGDGGGEVIALYDVLEVPLDEPGFMSDPDSGIITVTGANNTGTGYPAAFVRVRVSDRAVIGSGFLPEP
jgi:hypothetical protein